MKPAHSTAAVRAINTELMMTFAQARHWNERDRYRYSGRECLRALEYFGAEFEGIVDFCIVAQGFVEYGSQSVTLLLTTFGLKEELTRRASIPVGHVQTTQSIRAWLLRELGECNTPFTRGRKGLTAEGRMLAHLIRPAFTWKPTPPRVSAFTLQPVSMT